MKTKKQLKYFIASIIMLLLIVLANKANADTGTVSTDTLNLRKEASTTSSILELLNSGDKLEIISEEGNWYKVKHGSNEGYVSKEYVKVSKNESNNTTNTENTGVTTSNNSNTISNTTSISDGNAQTNTVSRLNITTADIDLNTKIKLPKETAIRILPLINSNVLENVNEEIEVMVIAKTNKWFFIQTDEIAGWVSNIENKTSADTTPDIKENQDSSENKEDSSANNEDTPNGDTTIKSTTKYINVASAYVRATPSTDGKIITTLIKNTDVIVTGENGDWYKIKYNSYDGYIYKELVSDKKIEETNRSTVNRATTENLSTVSNVETSNTNETNKGEQIVAYAKQYLGCPYVYGASGSSSFDCSGFTMYVYKHFGYSLSHSATAQSKKGVAVEKENLQLGDLVFFLDYETMDGIGHCGIYIGDGNFIHASSGSGYCVKISSLTSGSYLKRYAEARRLI